MLLNFDINMIHMINLSEVKTLVLMSQSKIGKVTLTPGAWYVRLVDRDNVSAMRVDNSVTECVRVRLDPGFKITEKCNHKYVEMGFMHSRMVCKICNEEKT